MATNDNKKNTGHARKAPVPHRKKRTVKQDSDFVSIPAKPLNAKKVILSLGIVAACVAAVMLTLSMFFEVNKEKITISGMDKYSYEQIVEAAGIRGGENLLTLNKAKISGRIITKLPYIKSVRIGIKLPDTVNIEVVEMNVAYAIEGQGDSWWLMDSTGKVVEKVSASAAKSYTMIYGVQIEEPQIGYPAVAVEPQIATDASGQTVPVTIRGSERLDTVVTILQHLENNGVVGQAKSLDVSNMGNIELWYEDRFQVKLGDTTNLLFKIKSMKQAIDQQQDYQTGIMDVSFTTWPDRVNLSRFPQ